MAESLSHLLRNQRAQALLSQARTIRDYPECEERTREAGAHVREAMLQRVLGNLTDREQHRVFSILAFAMPLDAPTDDERPPIDTFELPPPQPSEPPPGDLASFSGCPACDTGGRMTEE